MPSPPVATLVAPRASISALPGSSDVLIAGAGPTGLTLAAALAARGVRTVVVDRQSAAANTSRAAVVHAHTLEVLESIGAAERLVARGVPAERFTIRDRDRILVTVPFGNLPTRYPYTLMISQAETEAVLYERLRELGGHVHWSNGLASFEQAKDGASATLLDGTHLQARYIVGADGMHSVVRERSGIGFPGSSYGQSFSLADVRLNGVAPSDEVILYFSPAGLVVVAPLPHGYHRIVATVDAAPEHPDIPYVQALLDARGPERNPLRVAEIVWGSRFRVHHRVADSFRSGRVLLAGDAAHVHSPAGGQGMNTGIQDAIALADALTKALAGDEQALDAYSEARRKVAQQVVGLADRLTRLATLRRGVRPLRNTILHALSHVPAFRKRLAWRLSGLIYRSPA